MGFVIEAKARNMKGKNANRKYRMQGFIPGIIYGKSVNEMLMVERHVFEKLLKQVGESTIIKIKLGEKEYDSIVKDYQKNPLNDDILHVDFFAVEKGHKLKTHVPLHFVGEARGVKMGGMLDIMHREVLIEATPDKLPHFIEVDISNLDIGDAIHPQDIKVGEDVRILESKDTVIVSVLGKTKEEVEEAAEGEEETAEVSE